MTYTDVPLRLQAQYITTDASNQATVANKLQMWIQAEKELPAVRDAFAVETNKVRAARWDEDAAGKQFVARSERSQAILADWSERVTTAKASAKLRLVADTLVPTFNKVKEQVDAYNEALRTAPPGMSPEEIERPFRIAAGNEMNKLAGYYREAEQALMKIKGAPIWRGVEDALGSPRSSGGPTGGPSASPQGGPESGGPEEASAGGPEGGAAGGPEGGAAGGPAGGGPSLSGGASAPPIPTPKLPTIPTPNLPSGSLPFIPPMVPGGNVGSTLRPGVGGVGGTGGGRVPGVNLGGGIGGMGGTKSSVPTTSFGMPTNAAPGGVAPTSSPLGAAGTAAGPLGAGGVPPMMPPMGGAGMGAGGGGNGPGSGAAQRRGNSRTKRRDGSTPGLPSMLSGKAGKADANSFAVRGRRSAEPVVPATAHVVDEDLWRVDQWASSEDGATKPRRLH